MKKIFITTLLVCLLFSGCSKKPNHDDAHQDSKNDTQENITAAAEETSPEKSDNWHPRKELIEETRESY